MIALHQAKWHLRIAGDDQDFEVEQKLALAQALALQYVGRIRGDNGDPENTPPEIVEAEALRLGFSQGALDAAILLILGELWLNRESGAFNGLSPGVRLILDGIKERGYA